MNPRMNKTLLNYAALGGLAGVLIGVLVIKMNHAPTPEALRVLEHWRIHQMLKAQESIELADIQGPCEGGIIKALPSGLIAGCFDGKWGIPTQFGIKGADGVIRRDPPFCGPGAHVITDQQHGQLLTNGKADDYACAPANRF